MNSGLLLNQGIALNFKGLGVSHRGMRLSWMVISSLALHFIFFSGVVSFVPSLGMKEQKLQDYDVSLISKKFLDMEKKAPDEPITDALPQSGQESEPPPAVDAPPVKNAEVNMEIPKTSAPEKVAKLTPAKFFRESVASKSDIVANIPPPLTLPSSQIQGKAVSPEVVAPAPTLSSERNVVSAALSAGGSGSGEGTSPTGSAFGYPYYLRSIENKIAAQWAPPPSTISTKKNRAFAVVGFLIKQDGRIDVKSVLVEKSSGNAFFDMAALRAVQNGNPFPPLPKGISDDLQVHFSFTVGEGL